MKKALRCLGLVGILGSSLWMSFPRAAQATVLCEDVHRKACRRLGSTVPCTWAHDGSRSSCRCFVQGWICL